MYAHEDNVRFLYEGYALRGTVLVHRDIGDPHKPNNVYWIAVNPPEQTLQDMLIYKATRKVDPAILHYFDLTFVNPSNTSFSSQYQKYLGYFLLEIEEKDIIGKYWKPSGSWEGWVIKDEE
jgi:hypothetical protein